MKKMKKKVNKKTNSSSVHPLIISSDHHHNLSVVLPEPIFSLTLSLSQQDKHVLAYLLSSSSTSNNNKKTTSATTDQYHPPVFTCKCFSCYMSYWALWDSSPNKNLIHHIIDAFEDTTTSLLSHDKTKKDRKNKPSFVVTTTPASSDEQESELTQLNESEPVVAQCEQEEEEEQGQGVGSVRKLVNFLGEKIWSVWT